MKQDQSIEEGTKIADNLMEELGIQPSDLISGAYMDLILQRNVDGDSGLKVTFKTTEIHS